MRPDPQSGMSLVEMVVALAIVGVMSDIAVLSIGGTDRGAGAESEAMRLSGRLALAVDKAMIEGGEIHMQWDEAGYAFSRPSQAGESDADLLAGRHELGGGVRFAGPTSSGALSVRQDASETPVTFVLEGAGPDWRIVFDGLNASAERTPAP